MAFLFLFTGLLVGASIAGLSEAERDYYYENRNLNMRHLGNRDGLEIYRDNFTGQYYVDDGWEVTRIGTSGFLPHPVDRERLTQLCMKFNPSNLEWVDFLLASFEGREQQLWTNFFQKYELGTKPKEPTWGKGIRKARWADYGRQLDAWEEKKNELTPKFEKECREWDEKRKKYDETHRNQVSQAAGNALLQRALSNGATLFISTPVTASTTYRARVPEGSRPGDNILVNAGGQMMSIIVPPGVYAGQEISFQGPGMVQASIAQPPRRPAPAVSQPAVPPPAITQSNYSTAPNYPAPQPGTSAVPPAITSAIPPAITGSTQSRA